MALLVTWVVVLTTLRSTPIGHGQLSQAADWELLQPLAEPATLLPSGDTVYVRTSAGLWEASLDGIRWRSVALPGERVSSVAAHPADPRMLFAAAGQQLHRSEDGGASWRVALTTLHPIAVVRVSPADPNLVYAAAGSGSSGSAWRSEDGGLNWERLHPLTSSANPCTFTFPIVEPDPAVRERIYLSYGCYAGRSYTVGFAVAASQDAWTNPGASVFSSAMAQQSDPALQLVYPRRVAFSADGQRGFVVADRNVQEAGGGVLAGTENGGRGWRPLLDFPGESQGPPIAISTVERGDPTLTRAFVGLAGAGRGVLGTEDGGQTWGTVGRPSIGPVSSLAYRAAEDVLLAATDRGLWRLHNPHSTVLPRAGQLTRGSAERTTLLDDARFEPVREQSFERPRFISLAAAPGGSVIVAGPPLRRAPDGTLERLLPGDSFSPTMHFLAVAADGSILFSSDTQFSPGGTVNAITPAGEVVQLAGVRTASGPGSGSEARLEQPRGLAVHPSTGAVYVAESGGHVVRLLNPDGTLEVMAGTGEAGWPVDGALATETPLDEPWALAFDAQGRLLIADRAGHRVVRMELDGTLWTVAGTGWSGYWGDSGLATEARLAYPSGLALDGEGRIYLTDTLNHVVRVIDLEGRIWTAAGSGEPGEAEDGAPAEAPLHFPTGLAWSNGGLAVVEQGANRIRWIGPLP